MDIRIETLTMKNFLAWKSFSITFKSGVHLIQGKNGVGKSAIVDAISVALFNKPIRNINLPDLIHRDSNSTTIHLTLTINKLPAEITYTRTKTKVGTSYTFSADYNGEKFTNINEFQKILKVAGITYEKFKAMATITPYTIPRNISDYREIKSLVETFLNFEEFDEYAEYINKYYKEYLEHYSRLKQGISVINTLTRQLQNTINKRAIKIKEKDMLLNKTTIGKDWQRLEELEKQETYISNELSKIEPKIKEWDIYIAKKQLFTEKKSTYKTLISSKSKEITRALKELDKAKLYLEDIEKQRCPVCGQPLHNDDLKLEYTNKVVDLTNKYTKVKNELADYNKKLANIEADYTLIQDKISQMKPYKQQYTELTNRLIKIKAEKQKLKKELSNSSMKPEIIKQTLIELQEAQKADKELIEKYAKSKKYLKNRSANIEGIKSQLNEVKLTFVSKKNRALLVKDILEYIFSYLNTLLDQMDLEYKYNLNIVVNSEDLSKYQVVVSGNVAQQVEGLSSGQIKLISVLFSLAMALLYRAKYGDINILFLDDIFDTLDIEKIQKLVKFIEKLPLRSIYFLSHMENLSLPNIDTITLVR